MNYKLLLLAAAAALVVYSCSSDRDEVENPTQSKDEMRIENIKENNREESSKTGDSTVIYNPMSNSPTTGLEPENPDPSDPEIVHPGDVKPPKP
ncbi:hypothetical protein [uncultured Chryseobacterium sp.]|uniref:hypothetical protein n=1 Tax=uncultured Chryseobacterium sp. TaxID=259322 RepID=UPI0025FF6DA8|nr:hypothetical protein [uncultured Chryseobacterium sp.]